MIRRGQSAAQTAAVTFVFSTRYREITMLNDSLRYDDQGGLTLDGHALAQMASAVGTPFYAYSLPRALANLRRIQTAFAPLNAHIHFSAKSNANLAVMRALIQSGAGVDAVSAGEVFRAMSAGADPSKIVLAGVGKTDDELRYAVENGVGWVNVENAGELQTLDLMGGSLGRSVKVALRLNPEVTANTHPYIATGHGAAKFGLTADAVRALLDDRSRYPALDFAGIHIHIGSQLHDIDATCQAVETAVKLARAYPQITTLNIGGGLPVAYRPGEDLPTPQAFARALEPLLEGYEVLLEPGRSIIADAGVFVARVLYVKRQGGETFVITDGSMAELIRPALYNAYHHIVPVTASDAPHEPVNVVGPVCETADVLGREVKLPPVQPGDLIAVLTAGAYGMVMASNYNARPRPPELVVEPDCSAWSVARRRETWDDLIAHEI
jgi:diaminopimelate decarboxylase